MKTTGKLAAVAFVVVLVVALLNWGEMSTPVAPRPVSLAGEPQPATAALRAAVTSDGESRAAIEPENVEPEHVEQAVPESSPVVVRPTLRFWGNVVTDDGLPIAGARVSLLDQSDQQQVTGNNGLFEFTIGSSTDSKFVYAAGDVIQMRTPIEIEASGFGPARIASDSGHETPETALEVRLQRAASLTLLVRDANGAAISGARVFLSAEGRGLARTSMHGWAGVGWIRAGQTDQEGTSSFFDLPPRVELEVMVAAEDQPTHKESLVLVSGEATERNIILGSGTLVRGVLVDEDGAAVANQRVWLLSDSAMNALSFDQVYFVWHHERLAVQEPRTDDLGRFELTNVPGGDWWIGPAAESGKRAFDARFAPVATALHIEPGELEREIEIHAQRGKTIQGTVLDQEGTPVPGIQVSARAIDAKGRFSSDSDEDGEFTLGPMSRGAFEIRTSPNENAFCEPVLAQGGDSEVVLRVAPGASLAVQAIDASSGAFLQATYLVVGPRPREEMGLLRGDPTLEMTGLSQGLYDITATIDDGRIGVARGLAARLGSENETMKIPVAPGAALEVFYEGRGQCQFLVFDGETCVASDLLKSRTSTIAFVPVGRLRVEARLSPKRVQEQWVETMRGGRHEVSFRFE